MSDPKRASIVGTWAIAAGLVTPLCGLWFSCGCDWPWNEFFWACNAIVKNTPPPHCPWCVYQLTAVMSIGVGLVLGTFAAWNVRACLSNAYAAILYRTGIGTAVFVGVLFLGGWLTALATIYPAFLGLRVN